MARKSSVFEDLFDIVVKLPWWIGVVLAVVSYFLLHQVAVQPSDAVSQSGSVGGAVGRAFASVMQYLVSAVILLAAVVSGVNQVIRRIQFDRVAATGMRVVADLSWADFERMVGEGFRRQGYSVIDTPQGADGGIDLILHREGEEYLVQCKHWRANSVGVAVVRELHGVMASRGSIGGFVVTSGRFSRPAKTYAEGRNIELIDTDTIGQLLGVVPSADIRKAVPGSSQICPQCGAEPMIRRVARKGPNAGSPFWGCRNFPRCRATVPIK
ncbi:MAG TPA: restriction endonuclease [Gammaproteobacteria bacterium]|nr:restriction endonuclease [Gammaproteobacteria bacterium]